MLIQCTKSLLDQLDATIETQIEGDPLFSWHANLITINRRKTVVLVNDKNRYAIVLHGLKAKDFKQLDNVIIHAIREAFQQECIKDEIIDQFIHQSKEITYTKTKNRSLVARMNKACETLHFYADLLNSESIYQSTAGMKISRDLVTDGQNNYIYPNREMYKDLELLSGGPVISAKAVELKVTLRLGKHDVWRRIIIPLNSTFTTLHKTIQAAFGWQNYHLHEYYIYGETSNQTGNNDLYINHSAYHTEGLKPIVNLVCDEEAFNYENDVPMKLETGIKLSEYIPQYKSVMYTYDFGDDWRHYIDVVKVIDDFDKNYPVCTEGMGNTPPEDVGGESGYDHFLEIITDADHPDHQNMIMWAKGQGYKDFDLESVNWKLKYV